jgi:FKBP-type peptidyl-prolyl cis-trans isomerase
MKSTMIAFLALILLAGCSANKAVVESSASSPAVASTTAPAQSTVAAKPDVNLKESQNYWTDSKTFLTEYAKRPDVKQLPGGIMYRVIQSGTGANVGINDTVDVHYVATRPDGRLVMTSRIDKDSPPKSFNVKKSNRWFRIVFPLMKAGDRWEIVFPPSNLNKLTDAQGAIIYDMEILAVHKPK